jgi:hypothetical protein
MTIAVEGGTMPHELKAAKVELRNALRSAQAWLKHPDNQVCGCVQGPTWLKRQAHGRMEYASRLAELRNQNVRMELNSHIFEGQVGHLHVCMYVLTWRRGRRVSRHIAR